MLVRLESDIGTNIDFEIGFIKFKIKYLGGSFFQLIIRFTDLEKLTNFTNVIHESNNYFIFHGMRFEKTSLFVEIDNLEITGNVKYIDA